MLSCLSQGIGGWDGSVTSLEKPALDLHQLYNIDNYGTTHRHGVTIRSNNHRSSGHYCKQDGEILLPKTNLTRKGALMLFVAPEKVPGLTETEKRFMRKRLQHMNMMELNDKIGTIQRLGQSVLQYGDWDYDLENGSIADEENRIILKFLRGLDSKCIDMKAQPGGDFNQYLEDLRSRCSTRMSTAAGDLEDAADLQGLVNDIQLDSFACDDQTTAVTPNSSRPGSSSSRRVLSAGKLMSRIQSASTALGRPTSSIATVDSGYDTINQVSRRTTPQPRPVSSRPVSSTADRRAKSGRIRSDVIKLDEEETLQELDDLEYMDQHDNQQIDRSKNQAFTAERHVDSLHGSVIQPLIPSYEGNFGNGASFSMDTTTVEQSDFDEIIIDDSEMLPHDKETLVKSLIADKDYMYTASYTNLPSAPPPSRPFTPMSPSPRTDNTQIARENIPTSEIDSLRSSPISIDEDLEDEQKSMMSDQRSRPTTARSVRSTVSSQHSVHYTDTTRPVSRVSSHKSDISKDTTSLKSRQRRTSTSSSHASSVRSHKSTTDGSKTPVKTFNVLPAKSNQMPVIKHQDVKEITPKLAFVEEKTAKPTITQSLPTTASEKKLLDKRKSEKKSLKAERLQTAAAMETSLADEIKAITAKKEEEAKLKAPASAPPIVRQRVSSAKRKPSQDEVEFLAKEVDEMMSSSQSQAYDEGMSLEELELEKKLLEEKMSQAQEKITSTATSASTSKKSGTAKQKATRKPIKSSGSRSKGRKSAVKEDENSLEKQREALRIQKQLDKQRRLQEALRLQSQIQEKEEEKREELEAMEVKKKELEEQMDSLSAEAAEAWRMEEEAHEIFVANQIAAKQQREARRKAELERRRRETVEKRQQQRQLMESARQKEIDMLESIGSDPSERLRLRNEQRAKMEAEEAEEERKLREMEKQAKIDAEREEERIAELERLAEEEALARLRKERADAERKKRALQEEAEILAQEEMIRREEMLKEQLELETERERQAEEERKKLENERQRIMELQRMEEAARFQVQQDMEKRRSAALKRREHNLEARNNLNNVRQGQNVTRPWVFSYFVLWPRETYERLMGDDDNKNKRGSGNRFKSRSAPAGRKR